jgi:hypothetical protein
MPQPTKSKESAKSKSAKAQIGNTAIYLQPIYWIASLSLLVNVFTLSMAGYLGSRHGDAAVWNYAANAVCNRDYSQMKAEWSRGERSWAIFSEQNCGRNYRNGQAVEPKYTTTDGKYSTY